jgi:hypothetical protein
MQQAWEVYCSLIDSRECTLQEDKTSTWERGQILPTFKRNLQDCSVTMAWEKRELTWNVLEIFISFIFSDVCTQLKNKEYNILFPI